MEAKFITFKNHSGFLVRGSAGVPVPVGNARALHMTCAAWLTSQMEGAHFGTVQSYDGCGISGGLLHNIAVQPADKKQGSFWGLMRHVRLVAPDAFGPIDTCLRAKGWRVAEDGVLRDLTGGVVKGESIIREFSGPDGKTDPAGPGFENAKRWALLFAELLSDTRTWGAQVEYAVSWLASGQRALELSAYQTFDLTGGEALDSAIGIPRASLPPEVDLAMCVYHAFSANGPSPAATALAHALSHHTRGDFAGFARSLIRTLGTSDYGRWHDTIENDGNRYDATRKAVEKCGLWPDDLVRALMPKDLGA